MGAGLSRLAPDSLRPLDSTAKEWMDEHLPMDNPEARFWGDAICDRAAVCRPNRGRHRRVLVSVESLEALRRAYPNYFLDVFIESVKKAIDE
jgi:hypothetical protein